MGNYVSLFEKTDEEAKIILSSNKGDFITGHADLTGCKTPKFKHLKTLNYLNDEQLGKNDLLQKVSEIYLYRKPRWGITRDYVAVVEVQRMWTRFKQLGCDKKGFLQRKNIENGYLSQDVFLKNIIANLPKEKDGSVSFLVFLKFIHWLDTSDEETKLKLMFHFLNNGKDLDLYVLEKFFTRLYPENSPEEIRMSVDLFMKQLDTKRTGHINETQFVANILRHYPEDQLRKALNIDIIPPELLDEANMNPSVAGSRFNMKKDPPPMKNSSTSYMSVELDNQTLEMVASKAIKKDWEKLSIKLGFLEYDIKETKSKNNGKAYDTLLDLLIQWRDQDPYLATKSRLRRYLDDSNMTDASSLLS